jgi:hypothetical protein
MRISWTRLPVGNGQWFVYSPRFGRTYLLTAEFTTSAVLPFVIGLNAANRRDILPDPAESVELIGGGEPRAEVGWFPPLLYRFFHRHRTVASINRTIRVARWLARLRRSRRHWGAPEVGRVVMAAERSVGISDCYPRALLTAYLCLTAGLSCDVTVGILAPTTNMHAWCSTEGVIPYEPAANHWWYSPLVVFHVNR